MMMMLLPLMIMMITNEMMRYDCAVNVYACLYSIKASRFKPIFGGKALANYDCFMIFLHRRTYFCVLCKFIFVLVVTCKWAASPS